MPRHPIALAIFAVTVAAAAAFGAQFQQGAWYASLVKPSWNPPGAVFGPVWTVLYVSIAIAGWRVWCAVKRVDAVVVLWIVQLVLNAAWSWLFFGLHRPDLALADIVLLLIAIVAFIATARRRDAVASWLFIPYALWVAFATALNFTIWRFN
jgi:benzodiazapine receptor